MKRDDTVASCEHQEELQCWVAGWSWTGMYVSYRCYCVRFTDRPDADVFRSASREQLLQLCVAGASYRYYAGADAGAGASAGQNLTFANLLSQLSTLVAKRHGLQLTGTLSRWHCLPTRPEPRIPCMYVSVSGV